MKSLNLLFVVRFVVPMSFVTFKANYFVISFLKVIKGLAHHHRHHRHLNHPILLFFNVSF